MSQKHLVPFEGAQPFIIGHVAGCVISAADLISPIDDAWAVDV